MGGWEEGVPFPKEVEPSLTTYLGEPWEGQLIGEEMRESVHNAEEREERIRKERI